jgi:hypothetical protein
MDAARDDARASVELCPEQLAGPPACIAALGLRGVSCWCPDHLRSRYGHPRNPTRLNFADHLLARWRAESAWLDEVDSGGPCTYPEEAREHTVSLVRGLALALGIQLGLDRPDAQAADISQLVEGGLLRNEALVAGLALAHLDARV